jgi:hypothetical protein
MTALEILKEMKAAKTHCKHGHLWTPATTYIDSNGTRICKVCRARSMKAYYQRRKVAA